MPARFCSLLPLAWLKFQWGTVCSAYHSKQSEFEKSNLDIWYLWKGIRHYCCLPLCSLTCMYMTTVFASPGPKLHVWRCVFGIHIAVHCSKIHVKLEYNTWNARVRESPRGASHVSVELQELMGLCDLDSSKHNKTMHTIGHYESDEPISSPLWLLKGIHSSSLD